MANPVCEVLLTKERLEAPSAIVDLAAGAIVDFWGVVRELEDGREIEGIEYEAHWAMAEHQLRMIARQAALRNFGLARVMIHHRVGFVRSGEASLFVRVTGQHRAEAFGASQWVVGELKRKVPIWKHPRYKIDNPHRIAEASAAKARNSVRNMNWANRLTLSRLVLTILFVAALNSSWQYGRTAALILFLIAGITDFIDGEIARRYEWVTNFGKLMDPLVDKIMMAAAFISLVPLKAVPAWAATTVVARDFLITGLRLMASAKGQVLPAERLGKQKTSWQVVTVIFFWRCFRRANCATPMKDRHGGLTPGMTRDRSWFGSPSR